MSWQARITSAANFAAQASTKQGLLQGFSSSLSRLKAVQLPENIADLFRQQNLPFPNFMAVQYLDGDATPFQAVNDICVSHQK